MTPRHFHHGNGSDLDDGGDFVKVKMVSNGGTNVQPEFAAAAHGSRVETVAGK